MVKVSCKKSKNWAAVRSSEAKIEHKLVSIMTKNHAGQLKAMMEFYDLSVYDSGAKYFKLRLKLKLFQLHLMLSKSYFLHVYLWLRWQALQNRLKCDIWAVLTKCDERVKWKEEEGLRGLMRSWTAAETWCLNSLYQKTQNVFVQFILLLFAGVSIRLATIN